MALYVIQLKIAETIKNSKKKTFDDLREKILELTNEKEQIYKQNEEIINKVLNVYLKELKN